MKEKLLRILAAGIKMNMTFVLQLFQKGSNMERRTDSNRITREYIDSLLIEQRLIDSLLPSAKTTILGKEFETPVMNAAFSHLDHAHPGYTVEMAKGFKNAGALNLWGMSNDAEMESIYATGADTIEIIKPYREEADIFHRIDFALSHGAFAVGMDIDHAYGRNGAYDIVNGIPMEPKTLAQLRSYVKAAGDVPFIVKGVLSVSDAEKCVEAGVRGIIVSHHHGIFDGAVPPLLVLPDIKDAVGNAIEIYADCGFESGLDVFKALALGAKAISVSRAILDKTYDSGAEGVEKEVRRMTGELISIMGRTGFATTDSIDDSVIYFS